MLVLNECKEVKKASISVKEQSMISKQSVQILIIFLVTLSSSLSAMHASKSSLTIADTLATYNPLNACMRRTPFAWCLLKAAYNTITGYKAPACNIDLTELPDATTFAQLIYNAVHIKPEQFLWGVGTSGHQVDGNCSADVCSWARWELQQWNRKVTDQSGIACNHWNLYKNDIAHIKNELAMNTYRFSIEWSRVEPRPGEFDLSAIAHYADVCKTCIAHGIKPVIGLHHYTDPCWFIDQGGFEKEENIAYFTRFAATTCAYLYEHVFECIEDEHLMPLICTFNSPSGYAAKGYLTADAPPGRHGDMQAMQQVLVNILEAHVRTYAVLKQIGGDTFKIGILKNIHQLYANNPYNPLSQLGASAAQMLTDEGIFNFFTTGTYNIYMPCKVLVEHSNYAAPKSLDFIGLNHYSLGMMNNFKKDPHPDANTHTANKNYCISPESFYLAIKEINTRIAQPLNIPIYVTENGIAPINDKADQKNSFYQRYLFAMLKAIQESCDVRGYITWSLMDNFEWGSGYSIRYGLYHVDFNDPDLPRTLKPGAYFLRDVVSAYSKV
jgi:beta-glucosidase